MSDYESKPPSSRRIRMTKDSRTKAYKKPYATVETSSRPRDGYPLLVRSVPGTTPESLYAVVRLRAKILSNSCIDLIDRDVEFICFAATEDAAEKAALASIRAEEEERELGVMRLKRDKWNAAKRKSASASAKSQHRKTISMPKSRNVQP